MRTYIFGDSFIGVFKLLDSSKVRIIKFKGKSMVGISKENDEDAKKMLQIIQQNQSDIANIILWFGHVDILHVYYWRIINRGIHSFKKFASKVINSYGNLIDEIKQITNKTIYVLGMIYPIVADSEFTDSLVNYGIATLEETKKIPFELSNLEKRKANVKNFNKLLKQMCYEHSVVYVDINNQISDDYHNVLNKFKSVGLVNVHILWEPTIELWIHKLNKYGLDNLSTDDINVELNDSLEKYHREKTQQLKSRGFKIRST